MGPSYCLACLCVLARASASVFQLADMVTAVTGQEWSIYTNYGCYCGAGNSGTNVTMDCLDGCCEVHDNGYGELIDSHCNPYWTVYKFRPNPVACFDVADSCARRLCEQDRTLSICLSRWQHTYRSSYVNTRYTLCSREDSHFNKSTCREDAVSSRTTTAVHEPTSYQQATSWPPPQATSWPPPQATSWLPLQATSWPPPQATSWPPPQATSWPPPQATSWPPPRATSWSPRQPSATAQQSSPGSKPATSTQTPPTVDLTAVTSAKADTLPVRHEYSSPQSSPAAARDYLQPTACMTVLGYCRVFSLADLLMWITVVTILFTIGALLCFCTGVVVGRRKREPCRASSTCSCCCIGRMFRYHKLSSSSDLPETLSEL